MKSMLYPEETKTRLKVSLDGLWRFMFDPNDDHKPTEPLTSEMMLPVPSSFSEFFMEQKEKDYAGTFWYERELFIHDYPDKEVILRFAAVTHRCTVYLNGQEVGQHEGGFLPFEIDLTKYAHLDEDNRLTVKVSNTLSNTTLPAGKTVTLEDGTKRVQPYFDFYNYAGIQRSVNLLYLPEKRLVDIDTKTTLTDKSAELTYQLTTTADLEAKVYLLDESYQVVAEANSLQGKITVQNPHLWRVHHSYLYTLDIQLLADNQLVDSYQQEVGLREFMIRDGQFLLNKEPIHLKGFGRHEDFAVSGRSFNPTVMKKDFTNMKWLHANCFRTSHYPYDEEEYRLADREGILIIDEVPAVGFTGDTMNFLGGTAESFFAQTDRQILMKHHQEAIRDMIQRDKNHPSVIAWSLMNEPETHTKEAKSYFEEVFQFAKTLDPENRPLTFTMIMTEDYHNSLCYEWADFISLNRYYGWYVDSGDLQQGEYDLTAELEGWTQLNLNKPIIFTEFGADTLNGQKQVPSEMWSEEYQVDLLKMYGKVFDKLPIVQGELVWNLADFATEPSILRVNGNKKGVFTRERQPKMAAYFLQERWQNK